MEQMGQRKLGTLAAVAAGFMMMGGVIAGIGGNSASAQDMAMVAHPAHLHVGECAAPGEVVFPLSDVSAAFSMDGTAMAGTEMMGQASAIPVEASVTTIKASLADIVAGGHAIVVHESAENIGNYIACGAVGGMMMGTSDLPVGLGPLSDSGYSGVAWLHDNGDGTTMVYVFLTGGGAMAGEMEDMATPTS